MDGDGQGLNGDGQRGATAMDGVVGRQLTAQRQLDGKGPHHGSLTVMEGKGWCERNDNEPQVQRQWTATDGAMTTQQ
jgi:hypothetical protein